MKPGAGSLRPDAESCAHLCPFLCAHFFVPISFLGQCMSRPKAFTVGVWAQCECSGTFARPPNVPFRVQCVGCGCYGYRFTVKGCGLWVFFVVRSASLTRADASAHSPQWATRRRQRRRRRTLLWMRRRSRRRGRVTLWRRCPRWAPIPPMARSPACLPVFNWFFLFAKARCIFGQWSRAGCLHRAGDLGRIPDPRRFCPVPSGCGLFLHRPGASSVRRRAALVAC